MTAVGFIGLGTMGKPMAAHLRSGGDPLVVNTRGHVPDWDHSAMVRALEKLANFEAGQG